MWIRSSRGDDLLTGVECVDFFFGSKLMRGRLICAAKREELQDKSQSAQARTSGVLPRGWVAAFFRAEFGKFFKP